MRGSGGVSATSPAVASALTVPAAPAPSLTAPVAPPPPSLASAPAGVPADTAHAEDAYCALCRRCQMRKKLERRLAARRVPGGGPEPATGTMGATGMSDHSNELGDDVGRPQRDERSITELLDYIGERAETQGARGGRRARRKRAAAIRRRAQATADVVVNDGDGRGRSCKGRVAGDGACVALNRREQTAEAGENNDRGCGSSHASSRTTSHESHESHDDDDVDGEEDEGMPSEHFVLYTGGQMSSVELREKEYSDPVDREVEEFRRLLEAAHANPGRRTLVHGATR